MKRPNKEDYHQDKTGENLMNGPYNQTAYARSLEKYIDHLGSKNDSVLSGVMPRSLTKTDLIVSMINNLGTQNNTIDLDTYGRGLSDMYDALNKFASSGIISQSDNTKKTPAQAVEEFASTSNKLYPPYKRMAVCSTCQGLPFRGFGGDLIDCPECGG